MMLDTSAYHGQPFGQQAFGQQAFGQQIPQPFAQLGGLQPYVQPHWQQGFGQLYGQQLGQPFGQPGGQQPYGQQGLGQLYGQQLGQPFGQQGLGQLYGQQLGQPFGQLPYGQSFGPQPFNQHAQPFGPLAAILPQLALQSALGTSLGGPAWPGHIQGAGVPPALALMSLCAQLAPLAGLHGGAGIPFGLSPLGAFAGPLGQQHGYPIGQGIWGWPPHAGAPIGLGVNPAAIALQGLPAQMAMGAGIGLGSRMAGVPGLMGATVAPGMAGVPPLAYAG